ncbi:hypothetical protein PAXRUDRAFT_137111, partial [Paxillus rubicundulus Ve08.2h10]
TCQTANHKAADTSDPNAMCTRMMKPVCTLYRPPNRSNAVKGKQEKGQRDERVSGSTAPSSDDKCHTQLDPTTTSLPS